MVVYGRNSVEEALNDSIDLSSVTVEKGKEEKYLNLIRRLREKGINVKYAQTVFLNKAAQTLKHQGIIAELILPSNIIESETEFEGWDGMQSVIALDGITDTGNLGAVVRSALLMKFDAVVLPNDNSARITPQTIKASAGAVYKEKVVYINSLNQFIDEIKKQGFFVYGLAGEAETLITEIDFKGKVCLVLGSERKGIRKSVKHKCDALIKIPTTRKIDSFNASVAAAIAMWEVYRSNY